MVLGPIVAQLDGQAWEESLSRRILQPLQLRRTTTTLQTPHAKHYYVGPFADVPVEQPIFLTDALAPTGALASTVSDLARWHEFLLDPDESVLHPDSVEEMLQPQQTVGPGWERAYGLGISLLRRDGRVWFGHTGGAPGATTGAFSEAPSGVTSIVLTNNSIAEDPAPVAVGLGSYVVDHDPPPLTPWTPGLEVPASLAPLLGPWFSERRPFVFTVRQARLEARPAHAPRSAPPSVFAACGETPTARRPGRTAASSSSSVGDPTVPSVS